MILFIQDYVRVNHTVQNNGQYQVNYLGSPQGQQLRDTLRKLDIPDNAYTNTYAYPEIPEPKIVNDRTGEVLSYKQPAKGKLKPYVQPLIDKIVDQKPDLVVPNGSIACYMLLDKMSITTLRGKPVEVELTSSTGEVFKTWVLPMYSIEYQLASPNIINIAIADYNKLGEYYRNGPEIFIPKEAKYEFLDTFEAVKKHFDYINVHRPVTAWDLETNTLYSENPKAKVLVMSFSYREGEGFTFPLNHKEFRGWNELEYTAILNMMREFMADTAIIKVGHNIKFDIQFLNKVYGFQEFTNHRDTMIMYYQVVSQEVEKSFTLSDLAYEFTDMGGYDKPLDDYKVQYKKDYIEAEANKIAEAKAANKAEVDAKNKEADLAYKEAVKQYKQEHKTNPSLKPPEKPEKIPYEKFPPKSTIKLVSEVDGGDFNYEWIPLDILSPYAGGDTDACLRIHNQLIKRIEKFPKMYELATKFYPMLTRALARTQANGFTADIEYLKELETAYTAEEARLTERLREFNSVKQVEQYKDSLYQLGLTEFSKPPKERDKELAKLRDKYKNNVAFNPKSAEDKGLLLFKVMNCVVPFDKESVKDEAFNSNVTKSEAQWFHFKTDKHVLSYISKHSEISEAREIAELLLHISKVGTLKNGFTTKLLDKAQYDGKIHCNFKITGTSTSRLSSTGPNL